MLQLINKVAELINNHELNGKLHSLTIQKLLLREVVGHQCKEEIDSSCKTPTSDHSRRRVGLDENSVGKETVIDLPMFPSPIKVDAPGLNPV